MFSRGYFMCLCTLLLSFHVFGQTDDPPIVFGCHMEMEGHEPVPGFFQMEGSDFRSDSIDILDYHIRIDVSTTDFIVAHTTVTGKTLVDGVQVFELDLLQLNIDSVLFNNTKVEYVYDGFKIKYFFDNPQSKHTDIQLDVFYNGKPTLDPSNFGGLNFDMGYIYNLGIGLSSDPHNFGRSWYPCFDNFMERSTYTYEITHTKATTAHAVGTDMGTEEVGSRLVTTYRMMQQIPTYLSSIAISDYVTLWSEYEGIASTYPIKLMCQPADTNRMKVSFGNLNQAIECMESWYGPYPWERVGYVITTVGAMEHPTHTAYPRSSIDNGTAASNTRLMGHELAHNWWGNLVTLSTEEDMWIKEGNAEYGAHLILGHIYGADEFYDAVKTNHATVLNRAHIRDEKFRALSGMPNAFTYGMTTYNKGASVIHNLRGYMGDSLFRVGMNSILKKYAYHHLDAVEFKAQLEATTNLDMKPFFDAWIYNPGFAAYDVDSLVLKADNGASFDYTLYLQQRLWGTNTFHDAVPVSVTMLGFDDGQVFNTQIRASGQYDDSEIVHVPFKVKDVILNRDNLLNIARTDDERVIEKTGKNVFRRTMLHFSVKEINEPYWARVEHVYGAPDNHVVSGEYTLNDSHYWNIKGDINGVAHVKFPYTGGTEGELDYNWMNNSEDSILIFYRENPSFAWEPVAGKQLKQVPDDNDGYYRVENIKAGQYCLGRGVYAVATHETTHEAFEVEVFPNPTTDRCYVHLPYDLLQDEVVIRLYDQLGVELEVLSAIQLSTSVDLSKRANGIYFLTIEHINSGARHIEKIVKQF